MNTLFDINKTSHFLMDVKLNEILQRKIDAIRQTLITENAERDVILKKIAVLEMAEATKQLETDRQALISSVEKLDKDRAENEKERVKLATAIEGVAKDRAALDLRRQNCPTREFLDGRTAGRKDSAEDLAAANAEIARLKEAERLRAITITVEDQRRFALGEELESREGEVVKDRAEVGDLIKALESQKASFCVFKDQVVSHNFALGRTAGLNASAKELAETKQALTLANDALSRCNDKNEGELVAQYISGKDNERARMKRNIEAFLSDY